MKTVATHFFRPNSNNSYGHILYIMHYPQKRRTHFIRWSPPLLIKYASAILLSDFRFVIVSSNSFGSVTDKGKKRLFRNLGRIKRKILPILF